MREIDINTISIRSAYAYNKSGSIYYSNLSRVKNHDGITCYVIMSGKYTNGKLFSKKIIKISIESFFKLKNAILDTNCLD